MKNKYINKYGEVIIKDFPKGKQPQIVVYEGEEYLFMIEIPNVKIGK